MSFPTRQESELAEIRALARDLDGQVRESLDQVQLVMGALDEPSHADSGQARTPGAGDRPDGEPLLAFVHIPKTAGKTMTTMLAAAYTKPAVRGAGNYLRNPAKTAKKIAMERKQGGRVIVGHVPYGMFREGLPGDTRYMTVLREPADRVVSHYWRHLRRRGDRKGKSTRKVRADTLEEALIELRLPAVNNLMTRMLCGSPAPDGVLPPSAVDDAKRNLSGFAFVGIQERFTESVALLQRMLGIGPTPYENHHVNDDRPAVADLPDRDRELIAECNQLDAELYEFGRELFEEALAAAGAEPDASQ